jgi:uncharacterized protein YeaO (DUF488 family)
MGYAATGSPAIQEPYATEARTAHSWKVDSDMATATIAHQHIRLRPACETPTLTDGCRILIDRIWPHDLEPASLRLDVWLKDVAPSTRLHRWYGHDPARWTEFQYRYRQELAARTKSLDCLLDAAHLGPITLICSDCDEQHNEAAVLKAVIDERLW